ncbi:Vacuolar protein sorting-associated protein 33A [Choanephora cucurbitarum]|uniref:Vacuolar protein sorting-associated protein 33A n=1 Tax=Choanephora cucurbitarum TaxID=101091 RepID=A0A1C7NIF9_9FUNG|nr:Vacuolar protein sorting-associated protein 33A [Choanephora cucurbitarum]
MSSTGSHLGNTPLNLAKLRELSRKELPEILDKVRGKKGLVLDPTITGPLSLIAEFTLLKDHGVEKIYHLESDTLETECPGLIYICRPKLKYMRYIANHIKQFSKTSKIECWLFFVPQRTMVCERVLEEEGVKGDITIGDYAMDWIPYEDDLISMELDASTWKEIYLDGDQTSIYYAAKSLMRLQSIYGLFPRILGKGDAAKQLADMLLRMRKEQAVIDQVSSATAYKTPSLLNTVSNHIDQFIIIDRNVDLVTPLCTELTYEGLIDETMGIKHCFVELDASLVNPAQSANTAKSPQTTPGIAGVPSPVVGTGSSAGLNAPPAAPIKKKKYVLNSSDKLFSQLRDQNFAVVGNMLNKIAKRINENYEERHNAKTVAQIRDFVGRLSELQQEHQSLKIHTGIAEEIIGYTVTDEFNKVLEVQQNVVAGIDGNREPDYIEEMINKQKPLVQVLRLLCLMSLAQGGLKQKVYEHFEREIVQAYGYEHIETLHRLEKLGLWTKRTNSAASRSTFAQCRRLLKLIVDDVDERHPNDISYVYSGYAPLSIRLIQSAMQKLNQGTVPTAGTSAASLFSYVGNSTAQFIQEKSNHLTSNFNHHTPTQANQNSVITNTESGGWRGSEDILRLLPGQAFDIKQTVEYGTETNIAMAKAKRHGLQHGKTTIVFFLGGCTHTEVSAVRFLAQHDEGRDYLVATTQMINGNSILAPILQNRLD